MITVIIISYGADFVNVRPKRAAKNENVRKTLQKRQELFNSCRYPLLFCLVFQGGDGRNKHAAECDASFSKIVKFRLGYTVRFV